VNTCSVCSASSSTVGVFGSWQALSLFDHLTVGVYSHSTT
jgi:hypothetical protein